MICDLDRGILSAHPETARKRHSVMPGYHVSRDIVASIHLLLLNRLSFGTWLRSYRQKLTYAVFAWDDPRPALLELPTTLVRVVKRSIAASGWVVKLMSARAGGVVETKPL